VLPNRASDLTRHGAVPGVGKPGDFARQGWRNSRRYCHFLLRVYRAYIAHLVSVPPQRTNVTSADTSGAALVAAVIATAPLRRPCEEALTAVAAGDAPAPERR
jgi:hypothetical protein